MLKKEKDNVLATLLKYADLGVFILGAGAASSIAWLRPNSISNQYQPVILTFITLLGIIFLTNRLKFDRIQSSIKSIDETLDTGLNHLKTSEEDWRRALTLLRSMGETCIGYDTSSYVNADEYEKTLSTSLRNGASFRRLICFSPENQRMTHWFRSILSASEDSEGKHSILREYIKSGDVILYHFPSELSADYLIKESERSASAAIIGFDSDWEKSKKSVYTFGIYVTHRYACRDLREMFVSNLMRRAREHLRNELEKPDDERCVCCQFYDEKLEVLRPELGDGARASNNKENSDRSHDSVAP